MMVSTIASARKRCFTGVLSAILALTLWTGLGSRVSAQTFGNVTMGGGGYVTGIISCPTQTNLIYCKTDVGGAYRWDEPSQSWISLLDWCSQNQTSYQGVESLAIDPQSPAKVYILAGTSYWNGGATAILRSSDYGNTFAITDVTTKFKAHGNGSDRQKGETLSVDPNLGNILFCGTRANGLFKSTDSGVTWNAVNSLNVGSASISFLKFDPASSVPGSATPRIFVGVLTTGTNLYVSNDAGVSWTPLTNSPSASLPQRCALASDRNLYITYGNGTNGAIMKYNLTNGVWANCSPIGAVTYCGISVCATNPLQLVAATYQNYSYPDWGFGDWGDLIFVSSNGGTNWTDLFHSGKVSMSANGFPWIVGKAIHWAGALEMDPFNSDRVFVGSGNGIFCTTNLNSGLTTSTWKFMVKGLEETVPLNFISVPGGPFITSIGDYGGFIHTNITVSAPTNISQSYSFAYAAKTNFVARIVYNGELYYSKQFPVTFANKMPSTPGVMTNGSVAIASDGSTVLWKSVVTNVQTCYVTTNLGTNWTLGTGLNFSCIPEADAQNPLKFYAYNNSDGYCYASIDGGLTFAAGGLAGAGGSSTFCTAPGWEGHVWIALNNGGLKYSTNSGATFYSANVTEANAVAFGKTAPGASYPTLFIWGRPASTNTPGMYRSLDQAATWVRVNDTNHQYGGLGNAGLIEGDKNICGRVYMSSAGRGVPYLDSWVYVTNLTVTPVSYSIPVNGTVQLVASVSPTNSSNSTVTWASSNAAIASVTGAGLVTGNLAGTTTITATTLDGSFVASSVISVTNASASTSYWMDQNGATAGFGMANAATYYWLAGTPWTTDNLGNFTGGGIAWPNGNNAVLVGAGSNATNTVRLGTVDGSTGATVGNFGLNWNLNNATAIGAGNVNIGNPGDAGVLTLAASSTAGVAAGILTIYNPINLGGNTLSFIGGSLVINGAISGTGSLSCQAGGGLSAATVTLAGANTYSGTTAISFGNIFKASSINNIASPNASSSLGRPTTSANGTITLGTSGGAGTLVYTGNGETTDRILNLGGNSQGATLDQSGASGLLKFTSDLTALGVAATDERKTLTLQGSTAGTGEIAGRIFDSTLGTSGQLATSVTKAGTGAWTLSGGNTYSGGTTVNGGTLALKNIPASGSYSITNGAILDLQSGSSLSTSGYATFRGAGTLKLSTALSFGGANTTNWIVSLNPGGLIWVTGNSYINGSSYGKGFWTNNLGSLQVDASSTMNFVEAGNSTVQLDALQGGGTITAGYYANKTLTIGAANGSGTFWGTLTNNTRDGGNPLSLTKVGSGTQTLSGGNGYTGATTISAGTLLVNSPGSLASGSAVTVASGATLGGNGTIAGVVTNTAGGILSPGTNGVGTLTLNGNLLLKAGSTNIFVVNGSTPTNNSILLGASVTYGGVLNIVTSGSFTVGQTFRLFSGTGATTAGNFATILGSPSGGNLFRFTNGVLSVVSSGPTLTSVTPNPVTGSSYSMTIRLSGSGFTGATSVLLTNLTAGSGASHPFIFNSDSSISVSFVSGTAASTWTATVVKGSPSVQVPFIVTTPAKVNINSAALNSAGAGNLVLSGTGGVAGNNYAVQSTTNLNSPVVWTPVVTNVFDGSGNFSYTNPVVPGTSQLFLRIAQ